MNGKWANNSERIRYYTGNHWRGKYQVIKTKQWNSLDLISECSELWERVPRYYVTFSL